LPSPLCSSRLQLLQISSDGSFRGAHVLCQRHLSRKASIILPCIFEKHGVGELRADGELLFSQKKIGHLSKAVACCGIGSNNLYISLAHWRETWSRRLRPYLISEEARLIYQAIAFQPETQRLSDLARVNIGYVSGANDFFHLRPSDVERWEMPERFLHPTVRNGRALRSARLTRAMVDRWKRNDDPILLLRIPKIKDVPRPISRYLETDRGHAARRVDPSSSASRIPFTTMVMAESLKAIGLAARESTCRGTRTASPAAIARSPTNAC
jgi:hypothetical protein